MDHCTRDPGLIRVGVLVLVNSGINESIEYRPAVRAMTNFRKEVVSCL